jgi:hypothetical protein
MRALALMVLLAHADGPPATVPIGDWGGRHARLSVRSDGAEVELDCAHGHALQVMTLDDKGRFDVPGVYVLEHGGPVRRDEAEVSRPVRYRGSLDRGTLTLEVHLESGEISGPHTLVLGESPHLMKCR